MTLRNAAVVFGLLVLIGGCSTSGQKRYVEARAITANYTEVYVDYTFFNMERQNLGLGGSATPFSKGGTGGIECCAMLPIPGEKIRVEWHEETPLQNENKGALYSREVVVRGAPPISGDSYNYAITRFFPDHQIEVEFVSETEDGGRSQRLDQLFYGRRVMRHIGE